MCCSSSGPHERNSAGRLRQLMAKSAAFDPNDTDAIDHWRRARAIRLAGAARAAAIVWTRSLSASRTAWAAISFSTRSCRKIDSTAPDRVSSGSARQGGENSAMQYIFGRMSLYYFFANQLEMLEITNLETGAADRSGSVQIARVAPPPATTIPAANFRAGPSLGAVPGRFSSGRAPQR